MKGQHPQTRHALAQRAVRAIASTERMDRRHSPPLLCDGCWLFFLAPLYFLLPLDPEIQQVSLATSRDRALLHHGDRQAELLLTFCCALVLCCVSICQILRDPTISKVLQDMQSGPGAGQAAMRGQQTQHNSPHCRAQRADLTHSETRGAKDSSSPIALLCSLCLLFCQTPRFARRLRS